MIGTLLTAVPLFALTASLVLLALGAVQVIKPTFQFWPPPEDQQWKKRVFMFLFRIMVYGLVVPSFLHIWRKGLPPLSSKIMLALSLFFIGFCIAFASTTALGWSNAFGSKEGLRTNGIFKYSRNPIYIATWFGLAGWALIVPVPFVVAALFCWGLLYVFAIFIEEDWLEQAYGKSYLEYCRKVRRFI